MWLLNYDLLIVLLLTVLPFVIVVISFYLDEQKKKKMNKKKEVSVTASLFILFLLIGGVGFMLGSIFSADPIIISPISLILGCLFFLYGFYLIATKKYQLEKRKE